MSFSESCRERLVCWLLVPLLVWQPVLGAAEVRSADARSKVRVSANGTTVVDIASANKTGLSHNIYEKFNVGPDGVVLNNAQSMSKTELAGYIQANPHLKNGQASVILNEVVSTNPSLLRGYLEVAGKQADVIVANPYGITCDGCGFINTTRGMLTTGRPILDQAGGLSGFDIERGVVDFQGAGINAANLDRFAVLARSIAINAEIHGKDLELLAGAQKVDYETLEGTAQQGNENEPAFAIGSSALGGIYGDRIRLVGTDAGLGVRLDAPVVAQTGNIELSADGQIVYSRLSAGENVQVSSGEDLLVRGPTTAAGQAVLSGDRVSLSGGVLEASDITVTGRRDLVITGEVTARESLSLKASQIQVNDAVVTAENMALAGDRIMIAEPALLKAQGGAQAAELSIKSRNLNQYGTISSDGALSLSIAEQLRNSGEVEASGTLSVYAGSLDNREGALRAGEEVSLVTQAYRHSGEVQSAGHVNVAADTIHIDDQSEWKVLADLTLQGSTLVNQGVISSAGKLNLVVDEARNQGDIAALELIRFHGRSLRNSPHSLLLSAGGMALFLQVLENGGDIYALGDLDIAGRRGGQATQLDWEQPENRAELVSNISGLIASEGRIRIASDSVQQALRYDPLVTVEWADPEHFFETEYDKECFNRNRSSGCGKDAYRTTLHEQFVSATEQRSTQARLLAGGDIFIWAGLVSNLASDISSSGDIRIDTDRFENLSSTVDLDNRARTDHSWRKSRRTKSSGMTKKRHYTRTTMPSSENPEFCSSGRVSCDRAGAVIHENTVTESVLDATVRAGGDIQISGDEIDNGRQEEGVNVSARDTLAALYGDSGNHDEASLFRVDPLELSGFELPGQHGLFVVGWRPGHPYLVETNPLFADFRQFIGSQFLLEQLGWDPDGSLKLLGDGYYELSLIRQALSGTDRALTGNDYNGQQQFYKSLMENALYAAESLELVPGVSLSAEQINALQSDIVWMEEQSVAGHRVLVPVVYLAQGSVATDGALIAGNSVSLEADSVTNQGTVQAEQDLSIVAHNGDIGNSGTLEAGETLSLQAQGDIENLSGTLRGDQVSLDAGGAIVIETVSERQGDLENWITRLGSTARVEGNQVSLRSGADMQLRGADVNAGMLSLVSGGDLNISSVAAGHGVNLQRRHGTITHQAVRQLGSNLESSLDMLLQTEGDLSIMASELASGGDLSLLAKGDIEIAGAEDSDYSYRYQKTTGSFGRSKATTTESRSNQVVGSQLMAQGRLILDAEHGDISLLASSGHGEKGVEVQAGGSVRIESGVNSEYQRTETINKNAARVKTRDTGSLTQTLAQAGLSSGADLSIDAQGDVVLGAASLEAQDDLRIGDAQLATDDQGQVILDDQGRPVIERGSISNLHIGTIALENEEWDVKTRALRGPLKELANATSMALGIGEMYLPGLSALAGNLDITLSEKQETRTHTRQQVGSTLQAENIQLAAQDRVDLTGAQIAANEETGSIMVLGDTIVLDTAVTDSTHTERKEKAVASGIGVSASRDEVTLGGQRLTEQSDSSITRTLKHEGSQLSGNRIVLEADTALTLINADLNASGEDGQLALSASKVEITGVQDEVTVTETSTEKTTEMTLGVRNAYVDAGYAVKAVEDAGKELDRARRALRDAEQRVDSGELAKGALDDYRIMLTAATANLAQAELAAAQALAASATGAAAGGTGFYLSGSAQHSETTTTQTHSDKTWQGSSLSAANMSINADSARIIGSTINAESLDLNAASILLGAGKDQQSSRFEQRSVTGGASVSSSGAGSWNANAGYNEADSRSESTQFINSQLNVGQLNSSSDSLTLKGAVITANSANIDTNTLHIESLQDTHSSSNRSQGVNVGIGGGVSSTGTQQSGSGGGQFARGSTESRLTNEQSAILVADGGNSQITATDTTLVGGLIANASYNEDGVLVDHGNLNFSTDTLTVSDLRDYSREQQTGGGLQLSQSTTTVSAQNSGHRLEGETRATLGQGNVTVGGRSLDDDPRFAGLNRDLDEAQVITLDQQTGALDASVTVDNRVFSKDGRQSIKEQHQDLKGNVKATIAGAGSDLARVGVVAGGVVEAGQIGNALSRIGGAQGAAYHDEGALAGDIEGIRDGGVEDARYAQDALNRADAWINNGDGSRVNVTEGAFNPDGKLVAGAANTDSGYMYLDLGEGSRGSIVNTLIHEGMHLDGAGERMADLTGWLGDATYRLNAWANSGQIAQHHAVVPVQNQYLHRQLLNQNNAGFANDAVNGALLYRQLNRSEFDFLVDDDRVSRFAASTGQTQDAARRELVSSAAAAVDASWAAALSDNEANSQRARAFLSAEIQEADMPLFEVTDQEFQQSRAGLKAMMGDPAMLGAALDNLALADPARYRSDPGYMAEIMAAQGAGSAAGMEALVTAPLSLPAVMSGVAGWTLYAVTQPGQAAEQLGSALSGAWEDFGYKGYDDTLRIMQGDVYGVEFDRAAFSTEFGAGLGAGSAVSRFGALGRVPGDSAVPGDGVVPNNTATLSTRERVLSNIAESRAAREASNFNQLGRYETGYNFYRQAGFDADRTLGHLGGIDFSYPVFTTEVVPSTNYVQHVLNGRVGNYFAPLGTPADMLGINPAGRIPLRFTPSEPLPALQSTAAKIVDTWTVPAQPYPASGGGTQLFVPSKNLMLQVPNP